MTHLSGDEFNSHYEGSTSAITGETVGIGDGTSSRTSRDKAGPWNDYSDHEHTTFRTNEKGDHMLMGKSGTSRTEYGNNHIHYNPGGASVKKEGSSGPEDKYISEKIGDAVRDFFGW